MRRSIVVLALAALVLVGCSSSSDSSDSSKSSGSTTAATTSIVRTPDTSAPEKVTEPDRQLCAQAQTVANAVQANSEVSQALAGFASTYSQVQSQLSPDASAALEGYSPTGASQAANINAIEDYLVWCSGQG